MKRIFFLGAFASALSISASPSNAQFTGGVGDLGFTPTGAGSLTYQVQQGQNNSFNVGATTSIGVSSNVSSTEAYQATATSNLAMGQGGGYDVQYNGAGAGAGSYDFNGGTWDGAGVGAGAGAVTVGWNGGSTAILQSIGNSAAAGATAGSFEAGNSGEATATAAIGVVAGTFTNDSATGNASAIVSGIANKSNVFFGEGSIVGTDITAGAAGEAGTSQSGQASANSNVSTTANAATSAATFSSGFINVLGALF